MLKDKRNEAEKQEKSKALAGLSQSKRARAESG
jgi:hypothetical protein